MDDKVCERLREARLAKGLTQKQVAEHLQMHRTTYNKYEIGQTELTISIFRALVKLYDVEMDWLLGEQPTPTEKEATYKG